MIKLLPLLLLVGCTQTSRVLSPANAECIAECSPDGGCRVQFVLIEKASADQSILSLFNREPANQEDQYE